jgi:hypothetical protein
MNTLNDFFNLFYRLKIFFIKIIQVAINFFFLFHFTEIKYKKYQYFFDKSAPYKKNKIYIFEMFGFNENIIANFFWSIALKKYLKAEVYCYPVKINNLYNPCTYKIYKLLGFKMIDYYLSPKQEQKILNFYKKINFHNFTKKSFLKFKFCNTQIGDLINDHYIKFYKKITSDFNDENFKKTLIDGLRVTLFWNDFFKKKNVYSIGYSHTPYLIGIPGRVAVNFKVHSLNICGNNTFRINKKFLYFFDQFYKAKKAFSRFLKINFYKRKNILVLSQIYLKKRMSGNLNHDNLPYFYKKTFNSKQIKSFKKKKLIEIKKSSFNILIAAHDFYEGPNTEGLFIFSDYYEWIKYLINFSINCNENYKWFLKPHPDTGDEQIKILKDLLIGNKNIVLLPLETPNIYLIKSGIKFVLTNHGTIAAEFAYYNIPSLLCSESNIYSNFKFAIKSKNLNDYESKLKLLSTYKIKINRNEVLEFFYIKKFLYEKINEHIFFNSSVYNENPIINYDKRQFKENIDTIDDVYLKFYKNPNLLDKINSNIIKFLKNKYLIQFSGDDKAIWY